MTTVTWNPLKKSAGTTLSNNNLTALVPTFANGVLSSMGMKTGKAYLEIKFNSVAAGGGMVGVVSPLYNHLDGFASTANRNISRFYYSNNGSTYPGAIGYGAAYGGGNTIGLAIGMEKGTLEFYKDGISQGIAFTDLKDFGEVFVAVSSGSSSAGHSNTVNFGASPFTYPIPEGYLSYDGSQGYAQKVLFTSTDKKIRAVNKTLVIETTRDLEQVFLKDGIHSSSLSDIAADTIYGAKHYVQSNPRVLGKGKVFTQALDVSKDIKKMTIK